MQLNQRFSCPFFAEQLIIMKILAVFYNTSSYTVVQDSACDSAHLVDHRFLICRLIMQETILSRTVDKKFNLNQQAYQGQKNMLTIILIYRFDFIEQLGKTTAEGSPGRYYAPRHNLYNYYSSGDLLAWIEQE